MNRHFLRFLQWTLVALDLVAINLVFFIVTASFRQQALISSSREYTWFFLLMNGLWFASAFALNIYQQRNITTFENFTKATVHAFVYFAFFLVVCLFFFRMMDLSRLFLAVIIAGLCVTLLLNRFIYLVIYQYFRNKDWLINKIVVIGYNNLSKKLVEYLDEDGINNRVIGYCEEDGAVHELSRYPILSPVAGAVDVCKKYGATEIYSTIAPEHNQSLYQLIRTADENCIRFRIVPDLELFFKQQMHIDHLKEIPIISLRKEPLDDLGNRIRKRMMDIVVSAAVVVLVLSWMIPLLSLLIWLESRGPVFFIQQRTGKNGKNFGCIKFRSMKLNQAAPHIQATRRDSRVTRIGRFLRKTSLDEFPQFLNVLKGDMSLVGPRPHMLQHTDEYSRLIGQYMVRQFLKPGITGWAQVNGFRGETRSVIQMEKRVEHDIWYLENWSLLLDLRIVGMTAFNILKGDKNAF